MRHAKPAVPRGGRTYYGVTDYPLSDEGRSDAAKAANVLSGLHFDAVYVSPLTRARQTAELALPNRDFVTVDDLHEINLGAWEGRGFDEVREEFAELYERRGKAFADVAPPGGETFRELQRRAVPAFDAIVEAHRGESVIIVAHAALIWSIIADKLHLDLNDMFFFVLDYCGMHILETPPAGIDMRMRALGLNRGIVL